MKRRLSFRLAGFSLLMLGALVAACMHQIPAAPVEAAPAEEGQTRLVLLGTAGGPIVRTKRSQPAALLVVNRHAYLVDAGDGTAHRLAEAGYSAGDISLVFLTHLHLDHTAGLAALMAFHWAQQAPGVMQIYGPPGTAPLVAGALEFLSPGEELFASLLPQAPSMASISEAHEIMPLADGPVYEDENVRVFAVENTHYAIIPEALRTAHNWKSYAYRFETPDRVVVFTGDTGESQAVTDLARGADILVSEVLNIDAQMEQLHRTLPGLSDEQMQPLIEHMTRQHLSPEQVGLMANEAGVKTVVLTHISPGLDSETDMGIYAAGVREHFSGRVIVGRDLGVY